jgi:hypothetical protein
MLKSSLPSLLPSFPPSFLPSFLGLAGATKTKRQTSFFGWFLSASGKRQAASGKRLSLSLSLSGA